MYDELQCPRVVTLEMRQTARRPNDKHHENAKRGMTMSETLSGSARPQRLRAAMRFPRTNSGARE